MKKLLLILLLYPLLSAAQNKYRFENDTLYTSCGFKIYQGQTLQFGIAKSSLGFRYITITNGVPVRSLENNSIVVKELSHLFVSMFGFANIDITGSIIYKDGSKGGIAITLAFDQAIGSQMPGIPTELILPEEFRTTKEKAAELYTPFFEKDTLYTSCGYKIYKGQLLQFGTATSNKGRFKYVNIKNRVPPLMLQNNQVMVKELRDFGISAIGNGYITIIGTLMVNNNERGDIEMHIAFDHAIASFPTELLVPDEFKNRIKKDPEKKIERL